MKTVISIIAAILAVPVIACTSQDAMVPAYFYPGEAWGRMGVESTRHQFAIMNPNSGPGAAVDPAYVSAAQSAQEAGLLVLGYVATGYGERPLQEVLDEIDAYRSWYMVDGIFLDEASPDADDIPLYSSVLARIRHTMRGSDIVLNHGVYPDEEYLSLRAGRGMQITHVVFEGRGEMYADAVTPEWVHNYPSYRFAHLVYDTQVEDMPEIVNLSDQRNAGYIYVTDDYYSTLSDGTVVINPWDTLPPYYEALINIIN